MSTYKVNGIHGGILPKNEIQELLSECLRGVAPLEHNQTIEAHLVERHNEGDKIATMRLIYMYRDVLSVIICRPAKPPRRKAMSQKVWINPIYQDYEDFFHDTLTVFIELISEYNPEQGALENYMRGFLHQKVFYYHFREFIVNKMTEKTVKTDIVDFIDAIEFQVQKTEFDEEDTKYLEVYKAIDKLPPREKQVLTQTVLCGWNSFQSADDLNLAEGHIRRTKKIALDKLRKYLSYEELKLLGVVR